MTLPRGTVAYGCVNGRLKAETACTTRSVQLVMVGGNEAAKIDTMGSKIVVFAFGGNG